ncbi:rRNA maturation RNase YbeY [Marinilactibacillus piezotolerans]|uniref:rRNA maturation RNase YbeY n=1 Tax=Marinilactibacillus piezotolerans TaxID=258723 RepID=UPI0009AFABFB|nr:rRNA maturation RNase YbeY [Marinilactibacillus piezotolerans]
MDIILYDETNRLSPASEKLITDILEFAAKRLDIESDAELSVTVVDNERIQAINKEYRDKDYATDVISFAMEDDTDVEWMIQLDDALDMPRVLGDLFVSIDKTEEQAEEYGHSFERELGFLIVHGLLHLNGYDHMTEAEEKEMFTLQEDILKEYGLER